jgi:hypothetical protein
VFQPEQWAEKETGKTIENRTQPELVPNQASKSNIVRGALKPWSARLVTFASSTRLSGMLRVLATSFNSLKRKLSNGLGFDPVGQLPISYGAGNDASK